MNINGSNIIYQLRMNTLSVHRDLERKYPFSVLFGNAVTANDYRAVLVVLKAFHDELECRISCLVPEFWWEQSGYEPLSELLQRDLRTKETILKSNCSWVPENQAQAMGGLYVLMGSCAGASRLIRHLQSQPFIQKGDLGVDYYSHLASFYNHWDQFVMCFERACLSGKYPFSELCGGAVSAFGYLLKLCDLTHNYQRLR